MRIRDWSSDVCSSDLDAAAVVPLRGRAVKLLAIDTALNACSVAIVDGEVTLARVVSPGGKGNAERLLPVLEQARAAAGLALADLDGSNGSALARARVLPYG